MKMKQVISNAFDAMLASYEGKRFVPSLVLRLIMALASAVVTAVFANTLFSRIYAFVTISAFPIALPLV